MPITYPADRKEVNDRINTDVQNELPELDPFIRNTVISAITTGYAGASYDLNINQQNLQDELFPDTADGNFATRWGSLKGISPLSATPSKGYVSITGNSGVTLVESQLVFQSTNGVVYSVDTSIISTITILTNIRTVGSIVLNGTTAIVTFSSPHQFGMNDTVTISGANQSEYNVTTQIQVINDTQFSYTVSGSPASPATGTITATGVDAYCPVICQSLGANTNLDNGASLTFSDTVAGVNAVAHVTADGLTDGTDQESTISYRNRYLYAYQHPFAAFNDSNITAFIKTQSYVNRVWVFDIYPTVGQVTIYFTVFPVSSGNVIIPTNSQVNAIYNLLVDPDQGIKYATTDPADVIVLAPTPAPIDFTFTALDPNTVTMKTAIENSLTELFAENANVATTNEFFPAYAWESAIYQTVDTVTGNKVNSFTLSSPTGDQLIAAGSLATLGNITWLV
jgi:uncharacterized phage protein gp47/JayE